ncbi:hypothetical protein K1T71_008532 [Dendrolimus kikuchii]|uniref:Uncharacterized protein n=1 Tax=Dendrolimus kikuchii TaxID=765133 RepID=A0ACC1CUR1_9NEOP|nr:hypothetical protein K1T71_008532 [Dendrolimus kikuchii]
MSSLHLRLKVSVPFSRGFCDMDSLSMNQYEKQLYSVFKTFDINNEEALDKSAVQALCDALQLEERGTTLADALFEECSGRVTFAQFRNGLLAVLGDSSESTPGCTVPEADKTANAHPLSDDDSSGREVAPKFVFGSKKYGRRSRPRRVLDAQDESRSPRASSASRLETDEKKAIRKMRCRRSASVMDAREDAWVANIKQKPLTVMPSDFDHNRRIGRDEALALCRSLHLDAVDSRLIDSIFANSTTADTTVGDFFERLNISLTSSIEEVSNVNVITAHDEKISPVDDDGAVATEVVLEALDSAGVPQSRRLLLELGFTTDTVCPPDIEQALEEELQALAEPIDEQRDARALLFIAALALGRLRLELARQKTVVVIAERDKLRSDLVEANKRAGLLAQEVDESHARIENELKANLRRMEARHAETTRVTTAEYAAERDRAAQQRCRLEAELARRTDAENRLRLEINSLRVRIEEAETRASAAEEHAILAEKEQLRLLTELQVERERSGEAAENGRGEAGELAVKVEELKIENKVLRDRNDELCAELEAVTRQIQVVPDEANRKHMSQEGDLSTELNSIFQEGQSEECDSSPVSMDQRMFGHVEAVNRLREIFDCIQALPSPEGCCGCAKTVASIREHIYELSECGGMLVSTSVSPLSLKDAVIQTDASISATACDAEQWKRQLLDAQTKHDDEQQKLTSLVKDLETSLEQMKFEYDKCEEYWSRKMDEERMMFNEEQRLGDERLADLVAKIADYERQFAATATALPTIDEKYSLEAQVNDLEEEYTKFKYRCRRLEAASGVGGAGAAAGGVGGVGGGGVGARAPPSGEVRELRARTARAEAAVRRLHARLAAADLLVKDLYVENCHLAHRRHI